MKTYPGLRKKTSALALLFLALTLPGCSPSWLAEPLTGYLQKTTGLTIRVQETNWTLRPVSLILKNIVLERRGPDFKVALSLDRLAVYPGWKFSARFPFFPRFHIERLEADRPRGELRFKRRETRTAWRAWFKKIPPVHDLAIRGWRGEIAAGQRVFHFPAGVDLSGSYFPETGVRLKVQSGSTRGTLSRDLSVAMAEVRGEVLLGPADHPLSWKGRVAFSGAEVRTSRLRLAGLVGGCSWEGRGQNLNIRDLEARLSAFQGGGPGYGIAGEGELVVRGTVRWDPGEQQGVIIPSMALNLAEALVALEQGEQRWKGRLSGELELAGSLSHPRLQGQVRLAEVQGELPAFHVRGLRALVPVGGTYPNLSLTGVEARADDVLWRSAAFSLGLTQPEAHFSAKVLEAGRRLSLPEIRLVSREWGALTGTLEFDRRTGMIPNGSAELAGLPLGSLLGLFHPAGRPADSLQALLQGRVAWRREKVGAPWDFRVDLDTPGLTGPGEGAPWGLEDLGGRLQARLTWDPAKGEWSGEGRQTMERGRVFGKPGLIRWGEYPLALDWSGSLKTSGKTRSLEGRGRGTFAPAGPWEVSGHLDWGAGDWKYEARLSADQVTLEKFHRFWRYSNTETSTKVPAADLQGTVAADITLVGNRKGGRLEGRLLGTDLRAAGVESAWDLRVKNLDFPLRWAFGEPADPKPEEAVAGKMALEELQTPWIRVRGLEIPIRAWHDHYEIPGTLTLPLRGGELILETPVLSWPAGLPTLEAGLTIKGVALSAFSPTSLVEGSVQGDLGRVRLDPRRGTGPGNLTARVFDGWVEVRDWVMDQPFSADRRLQTTVVFDYINLEKVTRLFSFGHISGYVQGRVDDLVIQGNLPERFHLTLKTREVEGSAKRINIKAVENVSLLGTGFEEPGEWQKGINRWFQDYAYEEIGLSCRLANDIFTLRGTIGAGGIEYLVKSPGLYGIDVINRNPENAISFSDMLERLKRIRSKKEPGGSHDSQ
jgi:hypothetical protein